MADGTPGWDAVRNVVDERGITGQFILTSSYVLPEDAYGHTGTGRASHAIMRSMNLFESGESNGKVSLKDLFDGMFYPVQKGLEALVRGPSQVQANHEEHVPVLLQPLESRSGCP